MTFDDDEYTLSTGKQIYAHLGILGLGPHSVEVSEGYDGHVGFKCNFTTEERCEIAAEMIRRWTEWAK